MQKVLHRDNIDILFDTRKDGKRWLTSMEDCNDATMQGMSLNVQRKINFCKNNNISKIQTKNEEKKWKETKL